MIITCSQCNTRFKVGDDKLAAGPIRVRCSKCNFVFMASGAPAASASAAPAPVAAPHAAPSMPPTLAPGPPPSSPTPRPSAGPITGMFRAFGGSPEAPAPAGFASPSNRSGIFRAPSSDFRQPPADPFANLGSAPPPAFPPAAPAGFAAPGIAPPPANPGRPSPAFSSSPPGFSSSPPGFSSPSPPGFSASPAGFSSSPPGFSSSSPTFSSSPPGFSPPSPPPPAPPAPLPPSFGVAGDPFGRAMTPGPHTMPPGPRIMTPGTRGGVSDPFADVGDVAAPDPFGSGAAPGPFGAGASVADPFAGLPTAAATPHAKDPFGLGPAPSPAPTFAPPSPPSPVDGAQASSTTESFAPGELFGAGAPAVPDPFASAPSGGNGLAPVDDPFASLDVTGNADSMVATSPPRPPPAPEESDPFAQIGLDTDEPAAPAPPAAKSAPRSEPPASAPRPAAASPGPLPAPPPTAAESAKLRRMETAQRVRAVVWAAAQSLIFAVFVVVAVVVARGGTPNDLLRGDVAAAFGGPRVEGDLAIEDARVRKRTLPSGLEVVLVSGVVHNTTSSPVPGARIEVALGDAAPIAGWAWGTIDGVDVEAVATPDTLAALSLRPPASPSLAPGERAPFVLVGPAPADAVPASFNVRVTAPPPPAPPPAAPAAMAPTP